MTASAALVPPQRWGIWGELFGQLGKNNRRKGGFLVWPKILRLTRTLVNAMPGRTEWPALSSPWRKVMEMINRNPMMWFWFTALGFSCLLGTAPCILLACYRCRKKWQLEQSFLYMLRLVFFRADFQKSVYYPFAAGHSLECWIVWGCSAPRPSKYHEWCSCFSPINKVYFASCINGMQVINSHHINPPLPMILWFRISWQARLELGRLKQDGRC